MRKLPRMVAETPIEKEVEVVVWRKGKEVTFKVTLGELDETEVTAAAATTTETPKPAPKPKTGKVELLGMTLSEITPALTRMHDTARVMEEAYRKNVLVRARFEDRDAAEDGVASLLYYLHEAIGQVRKIEKASGI